MYGITAQTAMEIYTQPNDLYILVGKPLQEKKYAFAISRGPGHNYKPLLSSGPLFETPEAAIKEVMVLLQESCQIAQDVLKDPDNILTAIFNPNNKPIPESRVLNEEKLQQILRNLEKNNEAEVYITETVEK